MSRQTDPQLPPPSPLILKGAPVKKPFACSTLGTRLLLTSFTSAILASAAHGQIQSPSQQPPGERAGEDKPDEGGPLPGEVVGAPA